MIRTVTGPAAEAGLRGLLINRRTGEVEDVGDLILAVNGQEVTGNQEFLNMVANLKIGSKARLTIERDGERFDVEVLVRGV
jgi:S1-C subfamily serine protease